MQVSRCGKILWNVNRMNYKIHVKEIILKESGGKGGTETFVYEPSTIDEELQGTLYIIGWLQNRKARFEFLPNLIASLVRRELYKASEATQDERFEAGLKKANEALEDIGKTNKNIADDINFCVINIAEEKIRFAKIGDMVTWLWRSGGVVDIGAKQKPLSKKDLFSAVISGAVEPKDKFIFATGRVMDLFSDKGIKKLFALDLSEEADIITRIYQKHSSTISLPDQAAVLLEVKDARIASRWMPFPKISEDQGEKKVVTALPVRHLKPVIKKYTALLKTYAARNKHMLRQIFSWRGLLVFGALLMLALAATGIGIVDKKFATLRRFSLQLTQADGLATTNAQSAEALLKHVQEDALTMTSVWYLSASAEKIVEAANERIKRLHGIYTDPLSLFANIHINALTFSPKFIFNDSRFVYIFGNAPDTYLKMAKGSGDGSFVFLSSPPEPFDTERILAQGGDFYFINDTHKAAYVLFSGTHELVKVVKSIASVLREPSAQNTRARDGTTYALASANEIIKKDGAGHKEKMLLNNIPPPLDFELSEDGKQIFILTKEAVFTFPRQ